MREAFAEITIGCADRVLGGVDLQLIGSWMLNDRELPDGGTAAEHYAQRDDLPAGERDVARRIAAARLGLLRVVGAMPGAGSIFMISLSVVRWWCARSATTARGMSLSMRCWSAG